MSTNLNAKRPTVVKGMLIAAFEMKEPIMIWGPPGIGKSELILEVAKEQDRPVIDMRLALIDPTDMKGIPYYDKESNTMRWAQPADLPRAISNEQIELTKAQVALAHSNLEKMEKGSDDVSIADAKLELHDLNAKLAELTLAASMGRAVLFLDELTTAPSAIQASAYQLILDRRVGEYQLPDDVVMVCAGNRQGDRGVSNRMPTPLANRLIHVEMEASADDWLNWALKASLDPIVIGYIAGNKSDLFNFDPKRTDIVAFATPRSWAKVSRICQKFNGNLSNDVCAGLIQGSIGEGLHLSLSAFSTFAQDFPKIEDILEGKAPKLTISDKSKRVSAHYAIIMSCIGELKQYQKRMNEKAPDAITAEKFNFMYGNYLQFAMDNFSEELCVASLTIPVKHHALRPDTKLCKQMIAFTNLHGQAMAGVMRD